MHSGCKWLFEIRRVQPACGFPQTAVLAVPRLHPTPRPPAKTALHHAASRVHFYLHNCLSLPLSPSLFDLVTTAKHN